MRKIMNVQQTTLFDQWRGSLPHKIREKWLNSWEGVFRTVVLEHMPVRELGKHFHESQGCPSKELYSMAALVFLQEFNDWDDAIAVQAYEGHQNVRFALGLCPGVSELSRRTLQRYRKHLIEDDSAMAVFTGITRKLADLMGLKVEKQRLDSTHIFSNMARFGRTQLMGIMVKRFLGQVKRHAPGDYEALPEELRIRYEPPRNKLFGDTGKDEKSRSVLRQTVAEDMHFLVERFQGDEAHSNRDTYKQMARVFFEQCEIVEERICIKKKPGGDTMQNPSDPDATYDGKKGAGYQVQISETCHDDNEQQLITGVIPQTAVESDTNALTPMLDQLEANGLFPDEVLSDSLYGTDENTQSANKRGVDVVSPVKKGSEKSVPPTGRTTEASFEFDDEQKEVKRCPAGHAPITSEYDNAKNRTETFMDAVVCDQCSLVDECPVKRTRKSGGRYRLYSEPRKVRLTIRRIYEQSNEFKNRYRIRSGIEGTNSGLKRRIGLGRLRVRGKPRVFLSIIFKVAGWNILRASACATVREYVLESYNSGLLGSIMGLKMFLKPFGTVVEAIREIFFRHAAENCVRGHAA